MLFYLLLFYFMYIGFTNGCEQHVGVETKFEGLWKNSQSS